ncbi:MAG TPA: DUF2167 domain-containing protein [Polyangiaceae bacterium]|nr:DUF2167 domain-containing protein [Polyangiaceae bacterium]
MKVWKLAWGLSVLVCLLLVRPAHADPVPAGSAAPQPKYNAIPGPKKIDLGHDLSVDLPAGNVFLERADAKRLLESMGNVEGDDLLGLAAPEEGSWIAVFSYTEDGYVKDDDAKDLDAAGILKDIQQGTEEANKVRAERGFKPMHVDGWTSPPRYDARGHALVWGIKGSAEDGVSINEYTRILGRKGYIAVNVIDDPEHIAQAKQEAVPVLAGTHFAAGARYEDFDAKTDKVAEYGLAALIAAGAGAAALKAGLFAKLGAKLLVLLLAAKKAIVPLIVVAGASLKRFFARLTGKQERPAPPPQAPEGAAPPNE